MKTKCPFLSSNIMEGDRNEKDEGLRDQTPGGALYTFLTHRDSVTGDLSISFTLPGKAWTFCFEKPIPELGLFVWGDTEHV